jgi:signal transduction histidine kinase
VQASKALIQHFQRDALRARNLLVLGALIYPIWGLVAKISQPNAFDPIGLRILISGIFILTWWASHKVNAVKMNISKAVEIVGWILTLHLIYLNVVNHWELTHFTSLVIVGSLMFSIVRSQISAALFSLMYVGLTLICFSDPAAKTDPKFIFVSAATVAVIGIISMRARLETFVALQQEELRNSVFFSAMREGAVIFRKNMSVYWFNSSALKLTGLTESQLLKEESRPIYFKLIREDNEPYDETQSAVALCLKSGEPQFDQSIGVYVDETSVRWLRLTVIPFKFSDEDEPGALATFVDVTQEKLQKDQLIEQQGKLAASAKMTALGEMAAGIAHEINNPLTIITGKAAVALRAINQEVIDKPKLTEHLNRIVQTVDRISKIVHGMKNFARDSSHDSLIRTNLGELIEDTFNLYFEKFSRAQCEIFKEVQENLIFNGRGSEIQQVLLNLLQNALDATEPTNEKWIRVRAYKSGAKVVLEVSDSGEGIPATIRAKIMQPFFTTKAAGKGTGLGLSISRNIINNHQGTFELLDTPMTTFRISLPKAEPTVKFKVAA